MSAFRWDESLTDEQRRALDVTVARLDMWRTEGGTPVLGDVLRAAFAAKPRTRVGWAHPTILVEADMEQAFTVLPQRPANQVFMRVRITEEPE